MMKEIKFESFDKKQLTCYLWDDVESPKGVIQFIHGMASYASRSASFAEFLNKNGYIVFADDHRGHGRTASKGMLGIVGTDNFEYSVQDEISITKMLKQQYNLPVQLFAHSYGSFLAQRYIELSGNLIDGVLLSGSAHMGGKKLFFGKIITSIEKLFRGVNKPDKILYNIAFKANNKFFLSDKIDNAWLNSDLDKVKNYNDDPMCGYIMSVGFYYSLMRGLTEVYKEDNLKKIPKSLPIRIFSGMLDPVGGMGVKVIKLYDTYLKLGITNVKTKLYDNVRHEIISDTDSDKILSDILEFYNSNLHRTEDK